MILIYSSWFYIPIRVQSAESNWWEGVTEALGTHTQKCIGHSFVFLIWNCYALYQGSWENSSKAKSTKRRNRRKTCLVLWNKGNGMDLIPFIRKEARAIYTWVEPIPEKLSEGIITMQQNKKAMKSCQKPSLHPERTKIGKDPLLLRARRLKSSLWWSAPCLPSTKPAWEGCRSTGRLLAREAELT